MQQSFFAGHLIGWILTAVLALLTVAAVVILILNRRARRAADEGSCGSGRDGSDGDDACCALCDSACAIPGEPDKMRCRRRGEVGADECCRCFVPDPLRIRVRRFSGELPGSGEPSEGAAPGPDRPEE